MNSRALFACGLWAVAVTSCCGRPPASGSVFVSAVSVTDWAVYGSRFQPKFTLSESAALAAAVADTVQIEQSELQAQSLALRVKALQSSTELVDASGMAAPGAAPPFAAAKSILDAGKLALDPRLQFLLATALWQEVQVLNRYVLDALPAKDRTVPYLVRLQVNGHPDSVDSSYFQDLTLRFSSTDGEPVDVVPLLVNDHIEAALASRRDEEIRRMTLAIAAMFKGIGAGV